MIKLFRLKAWNINSGVEKGCILQYASTILPGDRDSALSGTNEQVEISRQDTWESEIS